MERIAVPFTGPGAGVGGLTWGQQQVWAAMREIGSSLPIGGVVPVTDGRTVDDFAAELRYHTGRHPSLRTLLRGDSKQETFGAGEAVLHVLDAADDRAAFDLAARWRDEPFDHAQEWWLRMGVACRDGAPTHVVAIMSHLAADLGGVQVMLRDLAERAEGPVLSPVEVWERQQEPPARRSTAAAMRHWETHLQAVPARRLPPPVDRGEPRYLRLVWRSPALYRGAFATAARLAADPAWVLLASFAHAWDAVAGGPLVAEAIIGNRFRPGLAGLVSPLTQNGLIVLDARSCGPDELVARARTASMSASKHAYYDPAARLELLARLPVELGVFYNDRRTGAPVADAPHGLTREPMRFFNEKVMVNLDDAGVTVELDTWHIAEADVLRMLTAMEAFAVSTR
ncbi:hypothetical protein ACFFX1_17110 [Dactylosporangium sucinum]|uniref:Condensation domain-containing protein n=1 Tax=Dactylosporangium sucinum TaxID=1424081 RepID=A0A917U661_9ACTN|nr:hypothetical protein [Dactylosporangium sucinum]GGM57753.1 hypothetical protein GCM10007977_069260 [Dactylosporangium sucinum]